MPGCRFAHRLSDLCAPDEREQSFANRWREFAVDRFYGQAMSTEQVLRVKRYYIAVPYCERPLWAHALCLLQQRNECECGYAFPWDFGLSRDYDDLLDRRTVRRCPFDFYPNIWERLNRRRQLLLHYPYPVHPLVIMDPLPRPMPPPLPAPPRGDGEDRGGVDRGAMGVAGRAQAEDAMPGVGMAGVASIGGAVRSDVADTMPASSAFADVSTGDAMAMRVGGWFAG